MSETYSDVDAAPAPGAAVEWQEAMASWPGVVGYKRRTHELLSGADRVVDVGCGPGDDVLALGTSRSIGVDRSAAMCARARARGATVVRADAAALPFVDGAFSGARADRILQHLDDPEDAVREVLRVVRPGGSVVLADPDQESLLIEVPGVRRSVTDRLKALRRDVGYRGGRGISRVPSILGRHGADVTSVEGFALVLRDPEQAFGLPTWPAHWRDLAGFTDAELAEWDRAISRPEPGFLYAVTVLVVAARRR